MKHYVTLLFTILTISFPLPKLSSNPYGLIDADIAYASSNRNSLDLYIPHGNDFPLILFIHGGSFVAGDRKEFPYRQIGETFQRLGFGCAVISYRLMRDSVWPAQPRDVAAAIRWLKDNIESYGGNRNKLYIVGHSAGGHLAALVSTDSTYLNEIGLSLHDIAGTVVIGTMMSDAGSLSKLTPLEQQHMFSNDWFFKIFGSMENFQKSLPLYHVNKSMPEMLILLADTELYDPPKLQTVDEFIDRAGELSVEIRYKTIADRTHMGVVEQMVNSSDPAVIEILNFFQHLKNK